MKYLLSLFLILLTWFTLFLKLGTNADSGSRPGWQPGKRNFQCYVFRMEMQLAVHQLLNFLPFIRIYIFFFQNTILQFSIATQQTIKITWQP